MTLTQTVMHEPALRIAALAFMDSPGVHALDALLRDREPQGRALELRPGLRRPVEQVLRLTGLVDRLPFCDGAA